MRTCVLRAGSLWLVAGVAACIGSTEDVAVSESAITEQPDDHCTLGVHNGHEYWFCTDDRSWSTARTRCEAVGAQLSHVDNAAENTFIRGRIAADAWIGSNDTQTEGQWKWSDDQQQFWSGLFNGSAVGGRYANWKLLQPNDFLGEDCGALLVADGKWDDRNCSLTRDYVCETNAATHSAPQAPDTGCFRGQRDGHDYWFCRDGRDFQTARGKCEAIGMQLVSIDDADENAFVESKITCESFIGLSDGAHEGTWSWLADGRPTWCGAGEGFAPSEAFANWDALQPFVNANCQQRTRNGRAYWFCSNVHTWGNARAACQSAGMDLVRINDAGENAFVRQNLGLEVWLGGSDEGHANDWRWSDGDVAFWSGASNGSAVAGNYTNWDAFLPASHNTRNCAAMHMLTGRWGDKVCNELRQFACEAPEAPDAEPQVPDTLDCGTIRDLTGRWAAVECGAALGYVCEEVEPEPDPEAASSFSTETEGALYQPGSLGITGFEIQGGVEPGAIFHRYSERLGLRDCIDTLQPGPSQPSATPGHTVTYYQQHYRGIPVIGGGYMVRRDPVHGARSAHGEMIRDLDVDVTPDVSRDDAIDTAAAKLGHLVNDWPTTPNTNLALVSYTPKGERMLAWQVWLPPIDNDGWYLVNVDAHTGNVLEVVSGRVSDCASYDPTATSLAPSTTVGHIRSGKEHPSDPDNFTLMTYSGPNETVHVMRSIGWLDASGTAQAQRPLIRAVCEGEQYPYSNVVLLPDPTQADADIWQPEPHAAASFMVKLQRSLEYFYAYHQSVQPGGGLGNWIGFDGHGDINIVLRLDTTSELAQGPGAYFSSNSSENQFISINPDPNRNDIDRIEVAGHEFAHGVWHALVDGKRAGPSPLFTSVPEARAINEGTSDVYGTVIKSLMRPWEFAGDFCFLGTPGDCALDLANPSASTSPNCKSYFTQDTNTEVPDPTGSCPAMYGGPGFCVDSTFVKCDPHRNSTVVSHWFYRLVNGGAVQRPDGCHTTILDIDPGTSVDPNPSPVARKMKVAAQILFNAVRDFYPPEGSFAALASATVAAARAMDPHSDELPNAVVAAWYAVNVWDDFYEGITLGAGQANDPVLPRRGAELVEPWTELRWLANDVDTWALDVDTSPTFNSDNLIHREDIRNFQTINGVSYVVADSVAMYPNEGPYYWRTYPSLGLGGPPPALGCSATHFIESTTDVPMVDVISASTDESATADVLEVDAGAPEITWTQVTGAQAYLIQVDDEPTGCEIDEGTIDGLTYQTLVTVTDRVAGHEVEGRLGNLAANHDYFLMIRPIGPYNAAEEPAFGRCKVFEIRTGLLPAPTLSSPQDNWPFEYGAPHEYAGDIQDLWDTLTRRQVSFRPGPLTFRWRDVPGASSYVVSLFPRDDSGNAGVDATIELLSSTSRLFANGLLTDHDPDGYCWSVHAQSEDGTAGRESERRCFEFAPLRFPIRVRPTDAVPYDSDVMFEWRAVTGATGYQLFYWPAGDRSLGETITTPQLTHNAEDGVASSGGPEVTSFCWEVRASVQGKLLSDYRDLPAIVEASCYDLFATEIVVHPVETPNPWNTDPLVISWSAPVSPHGFHVQVLMGDDEIVFDDNLEGHQDSLTIAPEPDTHYRVLVWILDADGDLGVMGSTSFVTKPCGGINQGCCDGACTPGAEHNELICTDDVCRLCGFKGAPCCDGAECGENLGCVNGQCGACGRTGEPCCSEDDFCEAGAICDGSTCKARETCDELVEAGANQPRAFDVDLRGRTSGVVSLSVNSFNVPDNIIVYYEGNAIAGTGCFGTNYLPNACVQVESILACCSLGQCSLDIPFQGTESHMTVEVVPNCNGTTDTRWAFTLSCPRNP